MTNEAKKSILEYAIEFLTDGRCVDVYGCDLHNKIFNEDYFINGYYNASEWLKSCNIDAFDAIQTVIDYEKDNFGEVNTKINSEAITNMLAYIYGEEVLNYSERLQNKWDVLLTNFDCQRIASELKSHL